MLGWEEVDRNQVAIILGGSLPLRAIAAIVDLILRYQLDIQLCPVATITPFFIFRNQYFGSIPQGAEITPEAQVDRLTHCFRILYVDRVKQALDVLNSSTSNRVFGGANLMVAASRALAHGNLLLEGKIYGAFNPIDFSIPQESSLDPPVETQTPTQIPSTTIQALALPLDLPYPHPFDLFQAHQETQFLFPCLTLHLLLQGRTG
jgi:hypothetical protein